MMVLVDGQPADNEITMQPTSYPYRSMHLTGATWFWDKNNLPSVALGFNVQARSTSADANLFRGNHFPTVWLLMAQGNIACQSVLGHSLMEILPICFDGSIQNKKLAPMLSQTIM